MPLTDLAVRNAKVTGKHYSLRDMQGLYLDITAKGGRAWHFRFYWAGKQHRMSCGAYPALSLQDARRLRSVDNRPPLRAKRQLTAICHFPRPRAGGRFPRSIFKIHHVASPGMHRLQSGFCRIDITPRKA